MDEQERIRMLDQLWGVIHRARCIIDTTEDVVIEITHDRIAATDAMERRAASVQKLLDIAMGEIKECLDQREEEEKP